MKQNQYYNKHTMNLKQLSRDLEKTGYKEWSVTYYKPFKDITFYKVATNWAVIKLLNKLLTEV